jgi:hypothetical protein
MFPSRTPTTGGLHIARNDGSDYDCSVDYFTGRVDYFVHCRCCQREIAILSERGYEDEKQPKIFSSTFHTFAECRHCQERHFYDYFDMKTRHEPEPALPH